MDHAVQHMCRSAQPPRARACPAALCCAGPLLQRATSLVFEGVPTYPTPSRCWEVVDKWQASADAAAI